VAWYSISVLAEFYNQVILVTEKMCCKS